MLNWDLLMTVSQTLTLISTLPTLTNAQAYLPRRTSAMMALGLVGITTALYGLGAPLGALVTALVVCAFIFIFIYRGTPPERSDLWEDDKGG
ncbi:hypothetical protein LCGC14_1965980 [marine sediment metagenome]|uniref:Uncharacterized protein n=1 Tax=marine sediment metagenome TaxID=412755 RepID=A0A0F9HRL5_9ZZZZ